MVQFRPMERKNAVKEIIDIYKDLLDAPDILSMLCKYIANSECGLQYDFGNTILKKGTKLYRIRKYSEKIDFTNPAEWNPAPTKHQNRCNRKGETALYLGSDENICLLETHITKGEKYALGEYEILNDIKIGGYTYVKQNESEWKKLIGILFNDFLIAPIRNENNKALFDIIDAHFSDTDFSNIKLSTLTIPKEEFKLSWRIGHINKKNKYYEITNKMCSILKEQNPNGIRYSSCYFPMETIEIECSAYNICLYESALKDIKYISHSIKTNDGKLTSEAITETILNQSDNAFAEMQYQ